MNNPQIQFLHLLHILCGLMQFKMLAEQGKIIVFKKSELLLREVALADSIYLLNKNIYPEPFHSSLLIALLRRFKIEDMENEMKKYGKELDLSSLAE